LERASLTVERVYRALRVRTSALADSVKFLEGEGASAAVAGEIGRERGDALKGNLGSGTKIEDNRFLLLSAARRRRLGKGEAALAVFGW
jgi:hypothetical protein